MCSQMHWRRSERCLLPVESPCSWLQRSWEVQLKALCAIVSICACLSEVTFVFVLVSFLLLWASDQATGQESVTKQDCSLCGQQEAMEKGRGGSGVPHTSSGTLVVTGSTVSHESSTPKGTTLKAPLWGPIFSHIGLEERVMIQITATFMKILLGIIFFKKMWLSYTH